MGSTFTLTLPRVSGATPALEAETDAPAPPALAPPAPPDALPEARIVLVINDDPAVRDLLPRALAREGLHFETAASGEEGLELAAALLPDLIILGVLLPRLDGWTVLRRLKDDPQTCAIPVLMLTITQDAEQGMVLGAADFMHKPIDTEQLAQG